MTVSLPRGSLAPESNIHHVVGMCVVLGSDYGNDDDDDGEGGDCQIHHPCLEEFYALFAAQKEENDNNLAPVATMHVCA